MKRLRPLILIGLILFLIGIVGFVSIHHIKASSKDGFMVEKEELDSSFYVERKTKNSEHYTLDIENLITEDEAINEMVSGWGKVKETQFLNRIEKYQNPQAQLHISVDVEQVDADFYNIIFQLNETIAGEERKEVKTFNLDVRENKVVHLTDILHTEWEKTERLLSIAKRQVKAEGEEWEEDDWLKWLLIYPDQANWHIDQDKVTFYEDAAPHRKVAIPMKHLSFCLTDWIVERLNIQSAQKVVLDPNGKYIALTFDDGPSPAVTPRVLDILEEYEAKATFFMLSSQAEYHPALAKQVADKGHEIGNHTINHPNLARIGEEQIRKEIEESSSVIENITGQSPVYFRPPYGIYNETVEQIAFENDSPIILWSVDSLDWKNRNAESVKNLVLQGIAPGSIILLHDIHPTTADALLPLMDILTSQGYQFLTVSELMALQEMNGVGPYYSVVY